MKAEVLSTGDEVASGSLVDSNAAFIAEKLEEFGLYVSRHNCVRDDMDDLVGVISEIGQRAEICVVTGGLGPTVDDLSAQAASKVANVELVLDEVALAAIESFFAAVNYKMNDSNKKQAYLPAGSKRLDNPVGTAPGFSIKIDKCHFFFLPGVPFEMKKMLKEKVLPELPAITGINDINLVHTLSTFGLPESTVNELLAGLFPETGMVRLGMRATFPEILVKLYARGNDKALLMEEIEKGVGIVKKEMGMHCYSDSGSSLEAVVGNLLLEAKATLAVAESCTGGLIASMLTDVAGSSDYFLFSGVTYSNDAKIKILDVKPETLEKYGAVSEETVQEMAVGAKNAAGATYGLATSGIAGPGGGTPEKPVGMVCIAVATDGSVESKRFDFPFRKRLRNKTLFAFSAIEMLRRTLLSK